MPITCALHCGFRLVRRSTPVATMGCHRQAGWQSWRSSPLRWWTAWARHLAAVDEGWPSTTCGCFAGLQGDSIGSAKDRTTHETGAALFHLETRRRVALFAGVLKWEAQDFEAVASALWFHTGTPQQSVPAPIALGRSFDGSRLALARTTFVWTIIDQDKPSGSEEEASSIPKERSSIRRTAHEPYAW